MVSGIESVTVGVQDLGTALAEFRDRLRLTVLRDTCASVGLLAAWRRPVHESVRLVELGMPDRAFGRVRLAQFEFEVGGETPDHAIVVGPHGLGEPVATITIVTDDPAASRRFYTEAFGWRAIEPLPKDSVGLFAAEPVRLTAYSAPGRTGVDVLLGHFPDIKVPRRVDRSMPGQLGIDLCTCRCEDLDEVERRLAAIGIEPVTPPTHVGLPAGLPGRVMLVRGPADELFELVELAV